MLSIVAPVFNEESHIGEFIDRCLSAARASAVSGFELILVNDGSRDRSAEIIARKIRENPGLVKMVELSRNWGQQPAFHAGLAHASGELVVTLDSDLQDPPELIPRLVEKTGEGFDLVYARRVSQRGGSWGASGHTGLKGLGAFLFHRLMSRIRRNPIPADVGEYRIMSRELVAHLLEYPEYMIFLPGLVAHIARDVGFVEYVRQRRDGRAHVTIARLAGRALASLTMFSTMPINLVLVLGAAAWLLPIVLLGWILMEVGMARVPAPLLWAVFAGAVLWCLTLSVLVVVAHYVGLIFLEVKRRPRYFVRRVVEKVDER